MKRYSLKTLVTESGYSIKTLEHWIKLGWLKPVSASDNKPNSTRYYTMQAVFEAERESLAAIEENKPKKLTKKAAFKRAKGVSLMEEIYSIVGKPRNYNTF